MVNVLKVYFKSEIRRVAVNSYYLTHYNALCEKVIELFPCLNGKTFMLGWKDEEGDNIIMSSDNELAQAVANATELMKIYVYETEQQQQQESDAGSASTTLHIGVKCDGCNAGIYGYRYKCLQCDDFDLCHACNSLDKHPAHDMLKMAVPSIVTRRWNFLGIRRLWSSMFGFHPFGPGRGMACGGGAKNSHCRMSARVAPNAEEKPTGNAEWPKCAETGQEFLQAVGASVANLLDAFGVDVKVYVDPDSESQTPEAEKQMPPAAETKKTEAKKSDTAADSPPTNVAAPSSSEAVPEASAAPQSDKPVVKTAKEVFMELQAKVQDSGLVSDQECTGARPKSPPTSNIYPDLGSSEDAPRAMADLWRKQIERVAETFKNHGFQEEGLNEMIVEHVRKIADGIAASTTDSDSNKPTLDVVREEAEKFAARLRRHPQESSTLDGWTFVNSETTGENTIPKEAAAMPAESCPTAEPSEASQNDVIRESQQAEVDATAQPSAPGESVSAGSAENTHSEEPLDPAVQSALALMLSMGYNNDGGWLVRLLKNKHGNINETLDSLYK